MASTPHPRSQHQNAEAEPVAPQEEKGGGPRRGWHDGSAYYDEKLKLWRGAIMLDGRRRWVSGKTEREAKRKLAAKRQEFEDWSLTDPNKLTVAQVVTEWLEEVVKRRRRTSTYSQYESPMRLYFLPRFGSKPVRELNPRHLERFYGELEDGTVKAHYTLDKNGNPKTGRPRRSKGLDAKSIRNLHTGLHAALARAVRHRQIPRNPADGVELPSVQRRTLLEIDVDDLLRLLGFSQAEGDPNYPLWVFLAHTGLRIGEALALRWTNVDLDDGWFSVEEDLDLSRKPGEVKTEAGLREIPMTRDLKAALTDHQVRQNAVQDALREGYDDRDLVFATATGKPNSERNALRSLTRLAKRAGLTAHIANHDFRRMCASLLVASGVDIATAAAILGHKRASVLLDVYAKALRAPKRAAVEKLQAALDAASAPLALPAPGTTGSRRAS